jgi:hypothetical protein
MSVLVDPMASPAPAETATGARHIKVRDTGGGYLLEQCEDPGCRVGGDGVAACGRLACPACGSGGASLRGAELLYCSCGHTWLRPG